MAVIHPTEEERVAICEWLTANGINVKSVPLHSDFAVKGGQIHYTEFVRDEETGNILYDPTTRSAVERTASAPCLVQPSASLNIPTWGP